jgi:hypothetical protein
LKGTGQIAVNNRIVTEIDAPISMPDGSAPPPGSRVEVVEVLPDSSLMVIARLHFRSGDHPLVGYYFPQSAPWTPGIKVGHEGTFRVRAYVGDSWDSALFRGESENATLAVGGSTFVDEEVLYPRMPPNLPINPFTLWQRLVITCSVSDGLIAIRPARFASSATTAYLIQTSTDLVNWEDWGFQDVIDDKIRIDVFANKNQRFYRALGR